MARALLCNASVTRQPRRHSVTLRKTSCLPGAVRGDSFIRVFTGFNLDNEDGIWPRHLVNVASTFTRDIDDEIRIKSPLTVGAVNQKRISVVTYSFYERIVDGNILPATCVCLIHVVGFIRPRVGDRQVEMFLRPTRGIDDPKPNGDEDGAAAAVRRGVGVGIEEITGRERRDQ